jgi:hypothetical protein
MEGLSGVSAGRELAENEAAGAVTQSSDLKSLDGPMGGQSDYQSATYASVREDRGRESTRNFAVGGRQSSQAAEASSTAESARIPPGHRSSGLSGDGYRPDDHDQLAAPVLAAYDRAVDALVQFGEEAPEFREVTQSFIALVEAQKARVRELAEAGGGQPPGRAFELVAEQEALVDDVEDAEAEAEGKGAGFWKKIMHWLSRAGKRLWVMISRVTTVKEWSLTGTVGSGVLGLAEASISVTFGQ